MGHALVLLVDSFIHARHPMDILPPGKRGLVALSFCFSCFGVCVGLGVPGFASVRSFVDTDVI